MVGVEFDMVAVIVVDVVLPVQDSEERKDVHLLLSMPSCRTSSVPHTTHDTRHTTHDTIFRTFFPAFVATTVSVTTAVSVAAMVAAVAPMVSARVSGGTLGMGSTGLHSQV